MESNRNKMNEDHLSDTHQKGKRSHDGKEGEAKRSRSVIEPELSAIDVVDGSSHDEKEGEAKRSKSVIEPELTAIDVVDGSSHDEKEGEAKRSRSVIEPELTATDVVDGSSGISKDVVDGNSKTSETTPKKVGWGNPSDYEKDGVLMPPCPDWACTCFFWTDIDSSEQSAKEESDVESLDSPIKPKHSYDSDNWCCTDAEEAYLRNVPGYLKSDLDKKDRYVNLLTES